MDLSLQAGWGLAFTAVALSALVGSLNSTAGLMHQIAVWGGGMVIWGLWGSAMRIGGIRRLLFTIFAVTGFSSFVIILYISGEAGWTPRILPEVLISEQGAGFDGRGGGTAIRYFGLSSLAFTAPMAAAGAMMPSNQFLPRRWVMLLVAVLAVTAALLAGRRAIAFVTLLAPLLVLSLQPFKRYFLRGVRVRIPTYLVFLSPGLIILFLWVQGRVGVSQARESVLSALALVGLVDVPLERGDLLRQEQAGELLTGWERNPILGAGLGAELESGYLRSEARPWQFELQYHQLLFSSGLVGVAILLIAAMCVLSGVFKAAAVSADVSDVLLLLGVGVVALMIANATNPYLQAVGHQWGVAILWGTAAAILRSSALRESPTKYLSRIERRS